MTAPLFLVAAETLAGDHIRLDGPEGRHAAAVRPLRPGERIDVTDGAGHLVEGTVVVTGRDWVSLDAVRRTDLPPPRPRLVVVQALAKADRGETAVAALTEVGVDEIVPWAAGRSVAQWRGPRGIHALERWRATARAAAKQSHRAWLPVVADVAVTDVVTTRIRSAALAVVLHEEAAEPLADVVPPDSGEVVVVIGPEGGLTGEEVSTYVSAGARVARLGDTVLRTSTAGVVAAAVLLARTDRWR